MERELWRLLYYLVSRQDVGWGSWRYSTGEIVVVYLWAVLHDRPTAWAACPENWPPGLHPQPLPTQSTLSRRLRKPGCVLLMTAVEQQLITLLCLGRGIVKKIDGKALAVSLVSKDPDVGYGRGAGGKQLGYKLHTVWGEGPMPLAWDLSPMNVSEKRVARWLIEGLPGGGYLLADTEYDANPLYDAAQAEGFQLVAKKRKGKGLGHHRQSPSRLRSIELLGTPFGAALYRQRAAIEASFGTLVTFGGGLASLPAWVRRFHRVRNWVQAKLLIAGTRSLAKNPQLVLA
jgi:hypothetical protein